MASMLAPDFSLPLLNCAARGDGPSKASLRASREEIHWLSIELGSLSDDVRAALRVGADESERWSSSAAHQRASLVVLATETAVELYSTEQDRRRAFRGPMESFAARVRLRPELGQSRTVERRGSAAARHLFQRAAGISEGPGRPFLSRVHAATTAAAAHAVLGPTLSSLFRVAANVGLRVRLEATSGSATTPGELESLVAERIVEEELAAWQAQEAELCRAEDLSEAFREHERDRYVDARFGDEPGSRVRIRAADHVNGLADVARLTLRAAASRK